MHTECMMVKMKTYFLYVLLNYVVFNVDNTYGIAVPVEMQPDQSMRTSIWGPPQPQLLPQPHLLPQPLPPPLPQPPLPQSPQPQPTTSVPKPQINYRLPTALKPVHYDVELKPDIYGNGATNFQVNGSVSINIDVLENTNNITLHSDWLNITRSSVSLVSDQSVTPMVTSMDVDATTQLLVISLDSLLVAGSKIRLSMNFTSKLRTDGNGLYLAMYLKDKKMIYLAATMLQATYARTVFPCFDEPALKATFNITLLRKVNQATNYTTLSNAEMLTTQPRDDDYVADIYAKTPLMSTYILAFVVSDFKYLENIVNNGVRNIKFRTWANSNLIKNANRTHNLGVLCFNILENYFDPPYPLTKLDSVAVPNFSNDMENWGLITYGEGTMYRPGFTTSLSYSWTTLVIPHEITHQWFGNIVSPKWWTWLWLNESFATYWERKIVNDLFPKQRKMEQFLAEATHGAMLMDSKRSSHPLNNLELDSRPQIERSFDELTYHKGGALARMMSVLMGEKLFIQALNRYLNKHQYGVVDDQDLWTALSEEAYRQNRAINMADVMETWVNQMNFPLVHVKRVATGVIHVTQERFLHSAENRREAVNDSSPYNYLWQIPITYTSSIEMNFRKSLRFEDRKWLSKTTKEAYIRDNVFPCPCVVDSWVYVNTENYFFRVNYEDNNWNSLIKQLNSNFAVIPPTHRAQLIHDSWFIAEAGKLSHYIALRVMNHLKEDVDYIPWVALQHFVLTINSHLQKSVIYHLFREFMVQLSMKAFNYYGVMSSDSEITINRLQRARIMKYACYFGNTNCLQQATALFREWKRTGDVNLIHPDLRSTIYCNGVRNGNSGDFHFVLRKFRELAASFQVEDVTQKSNLLTALACTKESWRIVNLFQTMLASNAVKKNDVNSLLKAMAENPYAQLTAWNMLKRNFDAIVKFRMYHQHIVSQLIVIVTSSFNTYTRYNEIRYFMKTHNVSGYEGAFKHSLKTILNNIVWMNKHYHVIRTWLIQSRTNYQ